MWKIPVYTTKANGKGKNTKTLVFESKYPNNWYYANYQFDRF